MHANAMKTASIIGTAGLIAATGVTAPASYASTRDVLLTAGLADIHLGNGTALIMGPGGWPVPGNTYLSSVDRLYLEPMGFTGNTVPVTYPLTNFFPNWDDRVDTEVASLVAAIKAQMASGDFNAENPLLIVGYSESAVAAGQAMQLLHDAGIPSDALHFIFVGDTASAHGGLLSSLLPSLSEWLREPVEQLLQFMGLGNLLGVTTPNDLYPTDVFTIAGDAWAEWPKNPVSDLSTLVTTLTGLFVTHLEYLGLTPDQIAGVGADPSFTDGLTNYWTIPDTGINPLEALWNASVNVGGVLDWFGPNGWLTLADWG